MVHIVFDGVLWRHHGDAPWHFVTLPVDTTDDIEAAAEPRPFGSVPVRARIGTTTWETSLFPDTQSGAYVLPVKRSVRDAESLTEGDAVTVELSPRASGSGG